MGERWKHPIDEPPTPRTVDERGAILIELLELTDALPPVPHRDFDVPSFRELCERR
jgi:hypothetical protein